ncbi:MAG TPA: class I SAM-dependent methyltransferase [Thermoanaerobaculia bacterium]|nr:class I SAM-dependent methyltransferase [Thermoanaerobaculia bacterium]
MTTSELRAYLRAAYIDLRLFITGKTEKGLPPLRLRGDVGHGDFRSIGAASRKLLIRHGLQPGDRVLDIGSGIGRVAIPLTEYMSREGSYEGFDVTRSWVRWCRRNITPAHPNFRFSHARVSNTHYGRGGVDPSEFHFPYPDASFDFAFAMSVFTHMTLDGVRNYIAEAHRVLRPGGTLVASFFFAEKDLRDVTLNFSVDRGSYRLLSESDPDWAIAFAPEMIDEFLPIASWRDRLIEPGNWRHYASDEFQDIVVVRKA